MSLVPPDTLASSTAPFADGARRLVGGWGGASGRAGRGGVVLRGAERLGAHRRPAADGGCRGWAVSPRRSGVSPRAARRRAAMIVAGAMSTVLVAMNYSRGLVELFTFIILLCTLSTLVPYVFCSLAVWLMPGQPAPSGAAAVVRRPRLPLRDVCHRRGGRRDGVLRVPAAAGAACRSIVWLRRAGGGAG